MTADQPCSALRQAAALMRERAEAATTDRWWTAREIADGLYEFDSYGNQEADATHIASWHPVVALAVAAELEREGKAWERVIEDHPELADTAREQCDRSGWTRIARAYLGTAS